MVTDNGNFVVDADFGEIRDPAALHAKLKALVGVLETGLFCGMACKAFFGMQDGSLTTRARSPSSAATRGSADDVKASAESKSATQTASVKSSSAPAVTLRNRIWQIPVNSISLVQFDVDKPDVRIDFPLSGAGSP